MFAVAVLTLLGANPWNLDCRAMPAEQRAPARLSAAVRGSFPWVPARETGAIHVGPVWLFALSSRTSISRDGDGTDRHDRYLHRAVIAVGPSYSGALTISGERVGKPGKRTALGFTHGTRRCRIFGSTWCASQPVHEAPTLPIPAGRRWRIARTEIAIGRTGCFDVRAQGRLRSFLVPLAVPGPDWGSSGW